MMIVDSKEAKQKMAQQLCILEIHQEIKVQASEREIVLSVDILAILLSSVVKEVQLCSKCMKRGRLPKACRSSSKPEKINNKTQFVLKQAVVLANQIISSSILAVLITSLVLTQKELFENLQPCSIKNVKDPIRNLLKKLVMYQ